MTKLSTWMCLLFLSLTFTACTEEVTVTKVRVTVYNADNFGLPNEANDLSHVRVTMFDTQNLKVVGQEIASVDSESGLLDDIDFGSGYQLFLEVFDGDGRVKASGGTRQLDVVSESADEHEILLYLSRTNAFEFTSAPGIDPNTREFVVQPSIFGDADGRMGHTSTTLKDGRILIIGGAVLDSTETGGLSGSGINRITDTMLIYDPHVGFWDVAQRQGSPAQLAVPRAFHQANVLPDGRILVTGGLTLLGNDVASVASAEILEISGDEVTSKAVEPMQNARAWHTATTRFDGSILIAGGEVWEGTATPKVLATAEVFDPSSQAFAPAKAMAAARSHHAAVLLANGSQVLVSGGTDGKQLLSSNEIFTSKGGRAEFSPAPRLAMARKDHVSLLAPFPGEANILFAGGFVQEGEDEIPTASVEVFDSRAGEYTDEQSMLAPRANFTLVDTGRNQTLLAAGGTTLDEDGSTDVSQDGETLSFVVDDPTFSSKFVPTDLKNPRAGHAASVLHNGMVVLSGGNVLRQTLQTAEIYNAGPPDGATTPPK